MSHLGDRVSALVDGELSHEERERALAHLAGCLACRTEIEAERAVKATFARHQAPAPADGLVTSLLRFAEPGDPLPPDHSQFPRKGPRPVAAWRPVDTRPSARPAAGAPAAARPLRRTRIGRTVRYAAGGVLTVAAATVGLAIIGGTDTGSPTPVVPPVAELTAEHARNAAKQPFADTAMLVDAAYLTPSAPASLRAPSQSGSSVDPGYGGE